MGYRIEYKPDPRYQPRTALHWEMVMKMSALFLAIFLLVTCLFWHEGKEMLLNILIPGDREVLSQAISAMLEQIGQGQRISDAVSAFCREIIDSAAIPN